MIVFQYNHMPYLNFSLACRVSNVPGKKNKLEEQLGSKLKGRRGRERNACPEKPRFERIIKSSRSKARRHEALVSMILACLASVQVVLVLK